MCKRFSSRFLIGFSSDFSTKSNPLNFTPTIFSQDFTSLRSVTALHYGLESKLSDAPFGAVHQDFKIFIEEIFAENIRDEFF